MADFVLVHSPLVGPATWEPVAAVLRARGHRAVVPTWGRGGSGRPPWSGFMAHGCVAAAQQAGFDDGIVLVGHSRAGAVLPMIGDRLEWDRRPVVAYLFVDAVLPAQPGRPWIRLPADLAAHLDTLQDEQGNLPPWPAWWPEEVMAGLIPEPEVRARVVAECGPVTRSMVESPVRVPTWWPADGPVGYLSFTYEDEAREAERRGWVVGRAEGHHLQAVVDPEGVVDLLLLMVAGLGLRP